jgi:hypothetical protein
MEFGICLPQRVVVDLWHDGGSCGEVCGGEGLREFMGIRASALSDGAVGGALRSPRAALAGGLSRGCRSARDPCGGGRRDRAGADRQQCAGDAVAHTGPARQGIGHDRQRQRRPARWGCRILLVERRVRGCGVSLAGRGPQLDETLDVFEAVWAADPVTFNGEGVAMDRASIRSVRLRRRRNAGRAGRSGGPRLGEGRLPHERRLLGEERLRGVGGGGGGSGGGRVSRLLHRSEPAATSGARPRGTHPIPTLNPLRAGARSAHPNTSASDISGPPSLSISRCHWCGLKIGSRYRGRASGATGSVAAARSTSPGLGRAITAPTSGSPSAPRRSRAASRPDRWLRNSFLPHSRP